MRWEFCPYVLNRAESRRQGTLLKVYFSEDRIGYADCHPWTELGDEPLTVQLSLLSKGEVTALTRQSLRLAQVDAEARAAGVSLFEGLKIPKSHYLVRTLSPKSGEEVDRAIDAGFTSVKVKVGKDFSLLQPLLERDVRFRLDFNERLTRQEFEYLLQTVDTEHVEFYEDPFPFDRDGWGEVQSRYGCALACDRQAEKAFGAGDAAQWLILKPACEDPAAFVGAKQKLAVTSYLDHPLGQVSAAYVAAQMAVDACGLVTHLVYEPNLFSEQLAVENGLLVPPIGIGFGFDALLAAQDWRPL